MDGDALSYGTCGSLIANLMLLAVMENISAPPDWLTYRKDKAVTSVHVTAPLTGWKPFIDDPGYGGARRKSCPEPRMNQAGGPLADAPLPVGYDPYTPLEQPFHACLLIGDAGKILSVKLLGSSGSARIDGRILALIAARWRVEPYVGEEGPAWHRVRLNAGPDEGEIYDIPQLY